MKPFLQSDFTTIHHPTRSHDSLDGELQEIPSNFCDTALHRSQCSFPFVLFSLNYTAFRLVELTSAALVVCLLAKQVRFLIRYNPENRFGGPCRERSYNRLGMGQMLSPIELRVLKGIRVGGLEPADLLRPRETRCQTSLHSGWSQREELHLQSSHYKGAALLLCYAGENGEAGESRTRNRRVDILPTLKQLGFWAASGSCHLLL